MKKEIIVPKEWIERLKVYTDRIEKSEDDSNTKLYQLHVTALLGYLDSLNEFIKDNEI